MKKLCGLLLCISLWMSVGLEAMGAEIEPINTQPLDITLQAPMHVLAVEPTPNNATLQPDCTQNPQIFERSTASVPANVWETTPAPQQATQGYFIAEHYDLHGKALYVPLYRDVQCQEILFSYWMGTPVEIYSFVSDQLAHVNICGQEGYLSTENTLVYTDLSTSFPLRTAKVYADKAEYVLSWKQPTENRCSLSWLKDGTTIRVIGISDGWLHIVDPVCEDYAYLRISDAVENDQSIRTKTGGFLYQEMDERSSFPCAFGEGIELLLLVSEAQYGWQRVRLVSTGYELIGYVHTDALDASTLTELTLLPATPID